MNKISKKLVLVVGVLGLTSGTVLGATAATKITAELKQMKIIKDNQQVLKDTPVISYNNSTYVPLRAFGEVTGVKIDYKDGTIYLGDNNTTTNSTVDVGVENDPAFIQLDNGILLYNPDGIKGAKGHYSDAKSAIKPCLKDSSTAEFDTTGTPMVFLQDGDVVVSGKVRATNSYGGYITSTYDVVFYDGDWMRYTIYLDGKLAFTNQY